MRLDHLLSKEQLSAKADSGPRPANVRSGCSKAETLVSSSRQRSDSSSTRPCGEGTSSDAAGGGDKHPVGYLKEQPLWLVFNARHDLDPYTDGLRALLVGVRVGCGLVVG